MGLKDVVIVSACRMPIGYFMGSLKDVLTRVLAIAYLNIILGKTEAALVVGTESMTNAPYLLPYQRTGSARL